MNRSQTITYVSWTVFIVVAVVLAVGFANLMVHNSEHHREEFKNDCTSQGGQVIDLRHRTYCLVDGEKIEF